MEIKFFKLKIKSKNLFKIKKLKLEKINILYFQKKKWLNFGGIVSVFISSVAALTIVSAIIFCIRNNATNEKINICI